MGISGTTTSNSFSQFRKQEFDKSFENGIRKIENETSLQDE